MNMSMHQGYPHTSPFENAVQELAGRLATGWQLIEQETASQRKEHLEDHWIHLLRQYEQACEGDISPSAEEVAA